jgi:hypothetical protein
MTVTQASRDPLAFLAVAGEMEQRLREFAWASTSIGAAAGWPQSLKTAVRIMLTSRQPIWIGWGSDLLKLYNDPYKAIIGGKHPRMLGRPAAEVWREICGFLGFVAIELGPFVPSGNATVQIGADDAMTPSSDDSMMAGSC